MMKKLILVLIVFSLISCGGQRADDHGTTENDEASGEISISPEVMKHIQELSDLDCRLFTLYTEAMGKKAYDKHQDQIVQLRDEKRRITAEIIRLNPDSAHLAAVHQEIKRLSDQDDYCPVMKELQVKDNPADRSGVPAKALHIKEDAVKLADMNCNIMNAYKKLDPEKSKREQDPQIRKLLTEKRNFLNELMVMYGHEVITGEMFRMMVLEAQEKKCNYAAAIRETGRYITVDK